MSELPVADDLPSIPQGKPMLVVLSGVSGAGKDAVRDALMAWRLPVHFVVTATNRAMRPGEVHGRDYVFVDDAEFERMVRDDELVEHAIVYGQRKGVPRAEVMRPFEAGHDVLARVDVQGAETLRRLVPDALLIFIAPPSLEELERRLRERGSETDEEVRTRIAEAASEMKASEAFDHVVVNETGDLGSTVRRVWELIASEKAKRAAAK
jgi:guanylate kinase